MSEHTEELWRVQNGYVVCSRGRIPRFYSKATRERIASDHNACLGFKDPETTVPELVAIAKTAVACWRLIANDGVITDLDRRICGLSLLAAEAVLAKTGKA